MPVRLQVKLLRALEEGVIERVGGEREISVDVRVEATTNVPLEGAVQTGAFRPDLYHRLAVLRIHLPPLRQRLTDLPLLVAHFLDLLNQKYRRHVRRLTPDAMALLSDYAWPGNIRELRNVLERVYVETVGEVIGRKAFDEWLEEREQFAPGAWNVEARQTPRAPLEDPLPAGPQALTPERLVQAYRRAGGNLTRAARLLGVHRATLYRRMQALGLTRDDLAAAPATAT